MKLQKSLMFIVATVAVMLFARIDVKAETCNFSGIGYVVSQGTVSTGGKVKFEGVYQSTGTSGPASLSYGLRLQTGTITSSQSGSAYINGSDISIYTHAPDTSVSILEIRRISRGQFRGTLNLYVPTYPQNFLGTVEGQLTCSR